MSSDGSESDLPDRDAHDRDAPGPLEFEQPTGPDRFRKVRARASWPLDAEAAGDQLLTAVVEVTEPGYTPPGLDVRGFITDTLLTCRVRLSALAELDQDPRIASIELGNRTDQID
ncbi:hypothetical protein ACIBL3_16700 [Kribbella sp. NPDC050124]|uniref:hypothetical protein n=1 Tax=Kribbella sp. NPDC050124 TaxID=3364114 RepID=UPI0037AA1AEF